jgi:threonine dehydratase
VTKSYLERILQARVYEAAIETPLEEAPRLSRRLSNNILFKREDLQPIFSFKSRGAYNKLINMPMSEREQGVICSSAGNHAQGTALAARKLGVRAVVVMPEITPSIKIEAVKALGGEVILHGTTYDDAYDHAITLAKKNNLGFIHPFDDPDVIAGQGTIAVEIHRQHPDEIQAIFVPIGGGGLIAGIAAYTKSLFPDVKIIGVEPADCAGMHTSFEAGQPKTLEHVGFFADGAAVRRIGDETFRLCREYVDEIVLVSTDEICAAIQDIFEDTRSIMEPAGALAVAGLKKYLSENDLRDMTFITINGGANVNFDRLRHITERAAIGEQREALIAVEIPEQAGSFLNFCREIGSHNVTEFNYRYADRTKARIFVGLELTKGAPERAAIIAKLEAATAGYKVIDMTDNEMAKLHVRYMVGGLVPGLRDERIFRFEFPERPGALLEFLSAVGQRWNISLFHYRNHGSDYGRVLAGVQVPDAERDEFEEHLRTLAYAYWDETDNPAYQMFLNDGPAL